MELAAKDLMESLHASLKQVGGKEGLRATALLHSGEYNSVAPVRKLWDMVSPSRVMQNATDT